MSEFPIDADVELHLQELRLLTGPLPAALTGIADVAVAQWLRDTGYSVWLSTQQTHEYEVRNGLIVPRSGIITLLSIEVNGSLLSTDQYRLLPRNHTELGIPAQYLQVLSHYSGFATVEAVYGWSDEAGREVPAEVWQAVLFLGCLLASSNLSDATATAGSLSSVQQGDVRYSYATENAQSRAHGWRQAYVWTVQRYRRMEVV